MNTVSYLEREKKKNAARDKEESFYSNIRSFTENRQGEITDKLFAS